MGDEEEAVWQLLSEACAEPQVKETGGWPGATQPRSLPRRSDQIPSFNLVLKLKLMGHHAVQRSQRNLVPEYLLRPPSKVGGCVRGWAEEGPSSTSADPHSCPGPCALPAEPPSSQLSR